MRIACNEPWENLALPKDVSHNDARASASPSIVGLFRRVPHNVDAEMAVLGGIILNRKVWDKVSTIIRPDHFVLEHHSRIYRACEYQIERGRHCDVVTLKNFFENDSSLQLVGGHEYLVKLSECGATPINAEQYANNIYDLYLRRELIRVGEGIVTSAYEGEIEESASDQLEDAEASLFALADSGAQGDSDFVPISNVIEPVFADARRALERRRQGLPNGLQTGFTDIDGMIGGFEPGQFILLAGNSSMGKTTVALNIAYNVAESYMAQTTGDRQNPASGGKVAIISLETSGPALLRQNLQSRVTGIPGQQLRTGRDITEEDIDRAEQICQEKLAPLPIAIMDSIPTIPVIRAKLRRLKRKHGLGLVIVDYLQLIRSTGKKESVYQKVTEISAGLKAIAKELHVPLIALSQLSRENAKRDNKRPQMSDLRDSGSIEENSDIIIFVYREHYYISRNPPNDDASQGEYMEWQRKCNNSEHKMELLLAKQRQGPTGTAYLYYDQSTALVSNSDRDR